MDPVIVDGKKMHGGRECVSATSRPALARHTSRSMAKSGFQLSGGTTLHIPYLLALPDILLIYSIGSRNSSSVGLNVGASVKPCSHFLGCDSEFEGCPRRCTVLISSGAARRALYGIVADAVFVTG